MQKGLFSGLFLIVMIALLTPTFIISDQSRYITDTHNHLDLLSLAVDNVITDVLLDTTIISCNLLPVAGYDAVVEDYLDDLLLETNKNNISCSFSGLSSSIVASDYEGEITLKCEKETKFSNIILEKVLTFEKNISASADFLTCTVEIKDRLDGNKTYANQMRPMTP